MNKKIVLLALARAGHITAPGGAPFGSGLIVFRFV